MGRPSGDSHDSMMQDMNMQIDPSLTGMGPPGHLTVPGRTADQRDSSVSSNSEAIPFNDLQNPSDALDILAQIASNDGGQRWNNSLSDMPYDQFGNSSLDYSLSNSGLISPARVALLVQRYKQFYHPYFPLVPSKNLDPQQLSMTARKEPHLLTAMLVIASKDLVEEPRLFDACSEHMQHMVSALAAGGPGEVEAVEALLLLAEWTPYTSRSQAGHVGRGEEDREAWMHVGNALRIGYFLGLDRYSFRVHDGGKDPEWQRKRLVWTACYISDRQISIRIGKAFWSRGPGTYSDGPVDRPTPCPSRRSFHDHARHLEVLTCYTRSADDFEERGLSLTAAPLFWGRRLCQHLPSYLGAHHAL